MSLWNDNFWPPQRSAWPRTGTWYINGERVDPQDVIRRDPNYVPFQSVLGYGMQQDPMHPIYPYIGYNGYGTYDAWSQLRPPHAMGYQYWDANGMVAVNLHDSGSYPWFYNDDFNWSADVDRPMHWLNEDYPGLQIGWY